MNKEFLHMQKLAGVITEGQYKEKLSEIIGDIDDTPHPDGDFDPMDYADDNNDYEKVPLTSEVKKYIDDTIAELRDSQSDEEWNRLGPAGFWETEFPEGVWMHFEDEFPGVLDVSKEVYDYIFQVLDKY